MDSRHNPNRSASIKSVVMFSKMAPNRETLVNVSAVALEGMAG